MVVRKKTTSAKASRLFSSQLFVTSQRNTTTARAGNVTRSRTNPLCHQPHASEAQGEYAPDGREEEDHEREGEQVVEQPALCHQPEEHHHRRKGCDPEYELRGGVGVQDSRFRV
jgi:hypothetical protein